MAFVLDPAAHRELINAVWNDEEFDAAAWAELHLARNEYNVKHVNRLTHTFGRWFTDERGRRWMEVPVRMNQYHMSPEDFAEATRWINPEPPYSRKFLANDHETGLGGQFEMIIRTEDNKRIDALTHEGFQETYNFGHTISSWRRHLALDVNPHKDIGGNYAVRHDRGYTRIHEPTIMDNLRNTRDEFRSEWNRGMNQIRRTGRLR